MNDEINERTRETELELREQIDLANSRHLETLRRLNAAKETLVDHESTNRQYHQLVTQMKVRYKSSKLVIPLFSVIRLRPCGQ